MIESLLSIGLCVLVLGLFALAIWGITALIIAIDQGRFPEFLRAIGVRIHGFAGFAVRFARAPLAMLGWAADRAYTGWRGLMMRLKQLASWAKGQIGRVHV